MSIVADKETGEVVTVGGKPRYGQWVYHLCRKWNPPKTAEMRRDGRKGSRLVTVNVDVPKLLGVAVIMASFGTDGTEIFCEAETIAVHAAMGVRQVKDLRQIAVALGMFRVARREGRKQVLEIAIPPDAVTDPMVQDSAPSRCGTLHPIYVPSKEHLSNNQGAVDCTLKIGDHSSADEQESLSDSYVSSDGAESRTMTVQSIEDEVDPADILDEMNQSELVTHCVYCHCRTCERNRSFGWFPGSEKYVEPSEPCQCFNCRASEPSTAVAWTTPNGASSVWPASSIGAEMADRVTAA